jgi:hypothetical protein
MALSIISGETGFNSTASIDHDLDRKRSFAFVVSTMTGAFLDQQRAFVPSALRPTSTWPQSTA